MKHETIYDKRIPFLSATTEICKKGPKKKLTKKDRARIEAEKAEELRIQREIERQNLLQLKRERLEQERIENEQRELREIGEQEIREKQLQVTQQKIKELQINDTKCLKVEKESEEWEHFLKCNGLPNPLICKEMNTYYYLWINSLRKTNLEDVTKRSEIIIPMISKIETSLENEQIKSKEKAKDLTIIQKQFEKCLSFNLDLVTYYILRDIRHNLTLEDMQTARLTEVTKYFILSLWTLIPMPIPLANPRATKESCTTIAFEKLKVSIQFPAAINCSEIAVRILWLHYDHLSHNCFTSVNPHCPKELSGDLYTYTMKDWKFKMEEKERRAIEDLKSLENIDQEMTRTDVNYPDETINQIITETLVDDLIDDIATAKPAELTVEQKIDANEDILFAQIREQILTHTSPHIINLRKYCIVGGVIHMNLLHQPIQPKKLLNGTVVTPVLLPKKLCHFRFNYEYVPPPPPEPGVRRLPEEIEAEIKKMEAEFDKLILFNIELPETVLWFEPPLVCQWCKKQSAWITNDIHDVKYNEDKFTIAFRAGKMGIFGIAVNKYANMPYQTWELKPEVKGNSVIFSITAAIIIIEFTICDGEITMTQLQNAATLALQDQIGIKYKMTDLIKILQSAGVNVFPSFDVFCYTEGTCEKLWPLERHLYYCMAFMSAAFNFTWSRWNNLAGRRNIILQMREFQEKGKQVPYSLLRVTPQEAALIDCTEVSQTFNPTKTHKKFFSDLYHLNEGIASIGAKRKMKASNLRTIYTVAELLIATRVLSFA